MRAPTPTGRSSSSPRPAMRRVEESGFGWNLMSVEVLEFRVSGV